MDARDRESLESLAGHAKKAFVACLHTHSELASSAVGPPSVATRMSLDIPVGHHQSSQLANVRLARTESGFVPGSRTE